MSKASIAIFQKKIELSNKAHETTPTTPPEVFEAALRVVESKGCELIKTQGGMYIVKYSETGPGSEPEGWTEWLPVYVAKMISWNSGGIKNEEMEEYHRSKENQESENQ